MNKKDSSKKLKQRRFSLTESDWNSLKNEAATKNISVSDLVRKKLKIGDKVKSRNYDYREVKKIDPELLRLIKNFTNNLNQIAKHVNTQKQIDIFSLELLESMSTDIKKLVDISDHKLSTEDKE